MQDAPGDRFQVFTGQIGKNRDLLHAELVQAQLAVRAAC
jgi:hypothetical protein